MMPGMDFKAAIATPHLWKNGSAQGSVAADLAQAQSQLKEAADRLQASGDAAEITVLSYRTMYAAGKALLHHAGYGVSNIRALMVGLKELFVKTQQLDGILVERLAQAQGLLGLPEENFKAAEAFLAKAKALTGST